MRAEEIKDSWSVIISGRKRKRKREKKRSSAEILSLCQYKCVHSQTQRFNEQSETVHGRKTLWNKHVFQNISSLLFVTARNKLEYGRSNNVYEAYLHFPFFCFLFFLKRQKKRLGSVLCRAQSSEWSIFSNTLLWWVIQLMIQPGSMVCCWKIQAILTLNLMHTLGKHNEYFMTVTHILTSERRLTVSSSFYPVTIWGNLSTSFIVLRQKLILQGQW